LLTPLIPSQQPLLTPLIPSQQSFQSQQSFPSMSVLSQDITVDTRVIDSKEILSLGQRPDSYAAALMGPASDDGNAFGEIPTRAAASQLRPFKMSHSTPEKEWLHGQEFGDDSYRIRAVVAHRASKRSDADAASDLEFKVVWMTPEGDVSDWQPAMQLTGNIYFKDYVRQHWHRLAVRVKAQVSRERRAQTG
jgi:hypothetical protein